MVDLKYANIKTLHTHTHWESMQSFISSPIFSCLFHIVTLQKVLSGSLIGILHFPLSGWSGRPPPASAKSTMTQEGQALPSPTPPENPAEPSAAAATTDPPAETHRHSQADTQLVAGASEDLEEAKQHQEEESREGEEEEAHREGERRGSDEGGEGDVEEKKLDSASGENQQTEVRVEGESEGTRGGGCADVVVISTSTGEEAAHEEVEKMEGEEEEEGKDNEERHPPAEDPQQAERWVHYIIFIYCGCL